MRSALVLLILFVISACTMTSVPSPDVESRGITAIPNQVLPTETDNAQATDDPTRSPVMTAEAAIDCPNAPAIRLIVQGRGRVTDDNDDTLNLRNGPGTSFDILKALNPGDEFMVIDGPTCADGFTWFRVRHGNNRGWIAEGDREGYYVEPYLSG